MSFSDEASKAFEIIKQREIEIMKELDNVNADDYDRRLALMQSVSTFIDNVQEVYRILILWQYCKLKRKLL
jgi:hypothetical protein